ncbi:MAG: hypothetical protein JNM99_03845 [Verrucomicrobiaceae bacterium]|nr:hypothetical protein [Verrucomicrobiaceae bacterium]
MPFDPSKPADHSPLAAAEMRSQLTGLSQMINDVVGTAIAGTSNNSNNVNTLGLSADGSYNPSQMQDVINKIDELITALRR